MAEESLAMPSPAQRIPRLSAPPSPLRTPRNQVIVVNEVPPSPMGAAATATPRTQRLFPDVAPATSPISMLGVMLEDSTASLPNAVGEAMGSQALSDTVVSVSDVAGLRLASIPEPKLLAVPAGPATPGSPNSSSPHSDTMLLEQSDPTGELGHHDDGFVLINDRCEGGGDFSYVPAGVSLYKMAPLVAGFSVVYVLAAVITYTSRLSAVATYLVNAISWALLQPAPYIYPETFGSRKKGVLLMTLVVLGNTAFASGSYYASSPKGTPQTLLAAVLAGLDQTLFTFYLGGAAVIWFLVQRRRDAYRARRTPAADANEPLEPPCLFNLPPPSKLLKASASFAVGMVFVFETILRVGTVYTNSVTTSPFVRMFTPIRLGVYGLYLSWLALLLILTRKRHGTHSYAHLVLYTLGISFAVSVCSAAISFALSSISHAYFDWWLPGIFLGYKLMFTGVYFFMNALTWRMGKHNLELRFMFVFQFAETMYLDAISYVSPTLNWLYGLFIILRVAYALAMQLGIIRMLTDRLGITTAHGIQSVPHTLSVIASRIAAPANASLAFGLSETAALAMRRPAEPTAVTLVNRILPSNAPAPAPLPSPMLRGGNGPMQGFVSSVPSSSLLTGHMGTSDKPSRADVAVHQAVRDAEEARITTAKYLRRPYGDTPTAHVLFAVQTMLAALLSTLCLTAIVAVDQMLPQCLLTCYSPAVVVYERLAIGTVAYLLTGAVTLHMARRKLHAAGIDWRETFATAITHLRVSSYVIVVSCGYVLINFGGPIAAVIRAVNTPAKV